MSKVILTQEQADAVEYFRETFIKNKKTSMSNSTLTKALNDGYEVKPEFKVGDWYHYNLTGRVGRIDKIENDGIVELNGNIYFGFDEIRHATPEEIAEEKERRWWAEHGREPWELKERDLLINENEDIFEVTNGNPEEGFYSIGYTMFTHEEVKRRYRVLCFAEDRLDVKDDE